MTEEKQLPLVLNPQEEIIRLKNEVAVLQRINSRAARTLTAMERQMDLIIARIAQVQANKDASDVSFKHLREVLVDIATSCYESDFVVTMARTVLMSVCGKVEYDDAMA